MKKKISKILSSVFLFFVLLYSKSNASFTNMEQLYGPPPVKKEITSLHKLLLGLIISLIIFIIGICISLRTNKISKKLKLVILFVCFTMLIGSIIVLALVI